MSICVLGAHKTAIWLHMYNELCVLGATKKVIFVLQEAS